MNRQLQNMIVPAVFAVLTFAYLAFTLADLFFVVQSQDYFVYDSVHFQRIATAPGWLVPYAGSFLTQFAYHPLLGILLFVLLLALLVRLATWAWRLPTHLTPLAAIPSVLMVMTVVGWDYGLFATRHYGNLFSPLVGMTLAVLLVGIYSRLSRRWMQYVFVAITTIVLYPLIGCYSLLAVLAAVLPMLIKDKLQTAVALVLVVAVPYIEANRLFPAFNSMYTYLAALPYMDYYHTPQTWIPLYAAMAYIVLIPYIVNGLKRLAHRVGLITSGVVALAAAIYVPIHRYSDSNFNTLMAVEHAYAVGQDDKVLELCAAQEHPIRSIIMYRNIELWKRGELLDKMFMYPWDSDTIPSENQRLNTMISGPRVFQQYTFWNFSYRWAMERIVKYNPSYADIQIMARDIVYNHEIELADKYLSQLENTLYYKQWAHDQRRLLDHDVWNTDSVSMLHRQIVLAPLGAIDNTEFCEYMLLKYFTNLFALTEKRAELCLAACMIMDKEDEFWQIVLAEVKNNQSIVLPRHVQEATLLFALKRQNPNLLAQIKLMVGPEGAVCQQFERNQDLLNRLCTKPMAGDANTLAALCPGTYWNFYFNNYKQGFLFD